jgi:hypothetical protein
MNTEILKKNQLPDAEVVLDPLSDRYRVCPNCETPHMVRNKGRDFCSDRCADQHYNARRRLMKQAAPKSESAIAPQSELVLEPLAESETASTPKVQVAEIAEPVPPQPAQPEKENGELAYEKNIQILNSLKIRIPGGTTFLIDDLAKSGFDFNAYSGRGVLHNIDPKLNCHFILYGTYRVYRVDFSHVLITKVEPLKPKSDD